MNVTINSLSKIYQKSHDIMRNVDGLQPQDALDELLKFIFFKEVYDCKKDNIAHTRKLNEDGLFKELSNNDANKIRELFLNYLKETNSWSSYLWKNSNFDLSDQCLINLFELFYDWDYSTISLDVRSAALRSFLSPEIRRGLGIYLTPDDVVSMIVDVIEPHHQHKVFDLACGSGTFLIKTITNWMKEKHNSDFEVWGTDKNARMLLLAELNLGHFANVKFNRDVIDALDLDNNKKWLKPNYYDVILTNPPFGVTIDDRQIDLSKYVSCIEQNQLIETKISSEVLFLEQTLRLLKPGGVLGIVLPKSILTNKQFDYARKVINQTGYVFAYVGLPPETFGITGTQSNAIVLFMRKFIENENIDEEISIVVAEIENVGFDSTGRKREGNQLIDAGKVIKRALTTGEITKDYCRFLEPISKVNSLKDLHKNLLGAIDEENTIRLGEVAEILAGRTPRRKDYRDNGVFLVKVGNLTGSGIDWTPRERNFISKEDADNYRSNSLFLVENDILTTASAHSPKYIGEKVDIINDIPSFVGGEVAFVREVLLIRPKKEKIDPYVLLAFLRSSKGKELIRREIRGQTAHIYPKDIMNIRIPNSLLEPNQSLRKLAEIIRQEVKISNDLSIISNSARKLMEELF